MLAGVLHDAPITRAIDNLYTITERAVATDQGAQLAPSVSGSTVVWVDEANKRGWALDLSTGERKGLDTGVYTGRCSAGWQSGLKVDGNEVAYLSQNPTTLRKQILIMNINTTEVRLGVPNAEGTGSRTTDVGMVEMSGGWLLYSDIRDGVNGLFLLSPNGEETRLAADRRGEFAGTIEGDYVAWKEALPFGQVRLFARHISTSQQWQLVDFVPPGPLRIDAYSIPAISAAGAVAWDHQLVYPDGPPFHRIEGAWLTGDAPSRFEVWSARAIDDVAISGGIVVFVEGDPLLSGRRMFGYDLAGGGFFIISQAVGLKAVPAIDGRTIVWEDYRNAGLHASSRNSDIFAATLTPGPAPFPPVTGAPAATDARIQIVWPQGTSVSGSALANIGVYLFLPDSQQTVSCQWEPAVRLWKAVNNGPARLVADGRKYADRTDAGAITPAWSFNDVDVSEASDPVNKIYFFVTVDGTQTNSNVWSHGEDARTYFPQQIKPDAVKPLPPVRLFTGYDTILQIVWPQGGLPVDQAEKVNVSASMFYRGTHDSPPPDLPITVTLYQSVNSDELKPIAQGVKRIVRENDLEYPVWDFNDIPVPAAKDPLNKYYLTARALADHDSSIWAHGADARTYFPQRDVPSTDCN